jgi:hypothetical protein
MVVSKEDATMGSTYVHFGELRFPLTLCKPPNNWMRIGSSQTELCNIGRHTKNVWYGRIEARRGWK